MNQRKAIAIITARGGSKRIPKKNIKVFCGRPIIEYSIQTAIESNLFAEVMVSTEDEEIAEIARNSGAKVPFMRKKITADDFSTTSDVLLEVLSEYRNNGEVFQYGCCIYPTAPFVTIEKLRTGMHLLENNEVDTILPVVAFSYPPQRGLISRKGILHLQYPEFMDKRSQDLETVYHDCGQFYFFRVAAFFKERELLGKSIMPFLMNPLEVQDIDLEEDWAIAEMKYKLMMERRGNNVF